MTRVTDRTLALIVLAGCAVAAPAAPYTLSTGTGDYSLSVGVSGHGSWGFAGGPDDGDAQFDPAGPTGPSTASYQSFVAIRVGLAGPRTQLGGGPTVTGTLTTGTSTFTSNGMNFTLVQTVAPLFNTSAVRTGSVLTQTYTITNPTAATINFELVRYNVTDMLGILPQIGGRVAGPPETVYERESVVAPAVSSIVVGFTGLGGTIPASNRFDVSQYSTLRSNVLAGTALADIVSGDGNANGESDAAYDVGEALRNTFSLAPGATDVYTTHTFFGTGDPATMFNPTPPPPPPPPPPGPPSAGVEGSYTGSSGTGNSSGANEGTFGMGARTARMPSTLLGPFLQHSAGGYSFAKLPPDGRSLPWSGAHLTVLNVTHQRPQTDGQQALENDQGPPGWVTFLATVALAMLVLAGIKFTRLWMV